METALPLDKLLKSDLVQKMQKYRIWIFLGLSAAYLVSYFHRAAPAVVGPEIIKELALQPAALGFMGSMYFWAYAAAMLPAGVLADTWGSRKTMSVFVLVAAVGGFIFGAAPGIDLLAVGRFLVGFGVGFIYVPAVRIMADWYRPDELATYSGILLAVGNIGALVSAAPLVALMGVIGWRNSFHVVGVFTVLAAAFTYAIVRNKPSELGLIRNSRLVRAVFIMTFSSRPYRVTISRSRIPEPPCVRTFLPAPASCQGTFPGNTAGVRHPRGW